MECRVSDLTDYQWCMEDSIKLDTFYNWVKSRRMLVRQKVVRDEITGSSAEIYNKPDVNLNILVLSQDISDMEMSIGGVTLKVPNGIDSLSMQ